ncbi:MAG: hypothetical protein IJU48_05465 [Synergistaceae bacterium]|nr:hypothetical protein [Synergistaceae bacterium]
MTDKQERIEQLLSMAWNTNSTARVLAIANQVLELNSENTEALILKADNIMDNNDRVKLLLHAASSLDNPENCNPDDRELLSFVINQRLAYVFFSMNNHNEAFKYCEAALKFAAENDSDPDAESNLAEMKKLYYRILIERHEWQKILEQTMRDEEHSLAWAYSRLISAWMIAPGKAKSVCANMFWDALMLGPDVPFYVLGYLEEPEDDAGPIEQEDFEFALMYYDCFSISEEFFNWFSRGAVLFGLLSNRFDAKEREYMLDVLDTLGGYEEYEKMSQILVEADDTAIIEALAAYKCLSD